MGLTRVTTKLTNMESPTKTYESIFLVDTGATDSLVPSDALEALGIRKEGRMSYELADGTVKEYSVWLGPHRVYGRDDSRAGYIWRRRLGTTLGCYSTRIGRHHGRSRQ